MAKPLIQIRGLRKVYRVGDEKTVALNHIDLDIEQGEICCLLGTSGSGKSTLLNMLAGLEKPTRGSIVIDGQEITRMSEKKLAIFRQANIGFVFQAYNLLPSLTATENVAMPLMFLGVGKRERNRRALQILQAVGLDKHARKHPTQMSGGQQQRVGIARAFVNTPKIVFCDEPTGNLDSKTTLEVMALIVNLAKEHGQTLIVVTHDPSIAQYADKIVRILDGDIQSIETNPDPILPPKPLLIDEDPDDHKKKHKRNRKHSAGAKASHGRPAPSAADAAPPPAADALPPSSGTEVPVFPDPSAPPAASEATQTPAPPPGPTHA